MYNIPKYLYCNEEATNRELVSHTENPRFIAEILRAEKHDPEIKRADEYLNKIEVKITDCYKNKTFDEQFVIAVLENTDQASNEELSRQLSMISYFVCNAMRGVY